MTERSQPDRDELKEALRIPPEWQEFRRVQDTIRAHRENMYITTGTPDFTYPEDMPEWWFEVNRKLFPEEKSMAGMMREYPSMETVLARSVEEVAAAIAAYEERRAARSPLATVFEENIMGNLSQLEREIIGDSFGTSTGEIYTVGEIAGEVGADTVFVAKIRRNALKKIGSDTNTLLRHLGGFLQKRAEEDEEK